MNNPSFFEIHPNFFIVKDLRTEALLIKGKTEISLYWPKGLRPSNKGGDLEVYLGERVQYKIGISNLATFIISVYQFIGLSKLHVLLTPSQM